MPRTTICKLPIAVTLPVANKKRDWCSVISCAQGRDHSCLAALKHWSFLSSCANRAAVSLSANQVRFLRALAHPLKPLVQVGHKGLTEGLLRQISEQLQAHELIKVRWNTESDGEPSEALGEVSSGAQCEVVQHRGRILTLYRRHPNQPKIDLPRVKK